MAQRTRAGTRKKLVSNNQIGLFVSLAALAVTECSGQLVQQRTPDVQALHPTCQHSFEVSNTSAVVWNGGGPRAATVNSNNNCAAATFASASRCIGNGTIDVSRGGPDFTGSRFGVWGGPAMPPPNFLPGATGSWSSPAFPVADPFAASPAPSEPPLAPTPTAVPYGVDGCPDQSAGCIEFHPGLYTTPILVAGYTAIFEPGVYYLKPDNPFPGSCGAPGSGCIPKPTGQCYYDFVVGQNGVVRPATTGDSQGALFFLSGTGSGPSPYGSVLFDAEAGPGTRIIDPYVFAGSLTSPAAVCPGGDPLDSRLLLPEIVNGSVLLGACITDSSSGLPVRGFVYFQDRNNGANGYLNGQPKIHSGGGVTLIGDMYFHNCPNSPLSPCEPPPTDFNAFLNLVTTRGFPIRVIGLTVADQYVVTGRGSILIFFNPKVAPPIL